MIRFYQSRAVKLAVPWQMLAAILTILSAVILYFLFGRKHQKILD